MNKKALLSSLMSVAMLTSIATGATYALFTAEDKVNVNVTAGKVNVTANVNENFKFKSLDTDWLDSVNGAGTFSTGGTVSVDAEGNITLDKIVPGDKVEFVVNVKNNSNVKVNFQSTVAAEEGLELFSGLIITVDGVQFNGKTARSAWKALNPGEGNRDVKISIELPETAGDEYQDKSVKISYTVNAIQGNAPIAEETGADLYVYTETDLRLFALDVNNGNTYAGKTVKLMAPIDLGNKLWTPIGTTSNGFQGTFDGQNNMISNLNVGEEGSKTSTVGLFATTQNGEIKNVHIENANIDGRLNVGVVAGNPYTSKYTNIKVTGHVTVDGMSYVGGVLGKNVYADVTDILVNVTEDSYVNANSVENGTAYRTYVGGVIGFNGEGAHTISNVTSNIDVYGSTMDVGGIAGIAHYENIFENCSSSGDVTIGRNSLEIGGIAGTWHNQNGTKVTFTNCSYTGELKAIVEGSTLDLSFANDGLVGAPYSSTGTGKLIVNGTESTSYISQARELLKNENAIVELANDITCDAVKGGYSVAGLVVTAGKTLDGNGHTLTVNKANDDYGSVIYATGGTIKNLTVSGAFRGIFMAGGSGDLLIENVTFENVVYTFNSDEGNKNYSVTLKNSTLNGWTSYSDKHKLVTFDGCNFGEGNGYAFCRPYNDSVFTNCNFEAGYKMDVVASNIVLENCTIDGVAITAENLSTLVIGGIDKVTLR